MHPAMCGATGLVLISTINCIFLSSLSLLAQLPDAAWSRSFAMGWWRQGVGVWEKMQSFSVNTSLLSPYMRQSAPPQPPAP